MASTRCRLSLLLVGSVVAAAQGTNANAVTFNRVLGGQTHDYANAVQQTSDGSYLLFGVTEPFKTGGSGLSYGWRIQLDANGNQAGQITLGGSATVLVSPIAMQQTRDGGSILVGTIMDCYGAESDDAWLVKSDRNGNQVWSKAFGGSGLDYANAVQQTSDGGYILAGARTPFGTDQQDAWLIKTDADGNMVWDKTFGGSGPEHAQAVQQTRDGGYILVGFTNSSGAGSDDAWLIKTDGDGNMEWNKTLGGSGSDGVSAVHQTSDGGYILAGGTDAPCFFGLASSQDAWLLKTDANGNQEWSKTFGGIERDGANAVQQTSDGGYIVAGHTWGLWNGFFGSDAWLIKTDANGKKVWDKTFGKKYDDEARAVQQTMDGGYIVAGNSWSTVGNDNDAWVVKTDAKGNAPKTP